MGTQVWALSCWHSGHVRDGFYQAAFRAHHFRKQNGGLEGVYDQGPMPEQAVKPGVVARMPFTTEYQIAVEGLFLLWQEQW